MPERTLPDSGASPPARTPRFLHSADAKPAWRNRLLIGAIAIIAVLLFGLVPPRWPTVTLPSGRTISHVMIGPFYVPGESPVLRFSYETHLGIDDVAALRGEALEIWRTFRSDAESRGYVNVAFLAQAPPSGFCFRHTGFCTYTGYGHVLRKRQDGLWYVNDEAMPIPD